MLIRRVCTTVWKPASSQEKVGLREHLGEETHEGYAATAAEEEGLAPVEDEGGGVEEGRGKVWIEWGSVEAVTAVVDGE